MKKYVIENLTQLEILARKKPGKNQPIEIEFSDNFYATFPPLEKDKVSTCLQTVSKTRNIVSLISARSLLFPLSILPKLCKLKLIHTFNDAIEVSAFCQELEAVRNTLEEVNITSDTPNKSYWCDDVIMILTAIRIHLRNNSNIKAFHISQRDLDKTVNNNDICKSLWAEIQKLLKQNQKASSRVTMDNLVSLHKDLENLRSNFCGIESFFKANPNNNIVKEACEVAALKINEMQESFVSLAKELFDKKQELDAGYFLALECQMKNPKGAYELLMKISKSSQYYQKANATIAHLLMDDALYCELFHPELLKLEETKGSKEPCEEKEIEVPETFMDEKRKKMMDHCILANGEEDTKEILSHGAYDYIHNGTGSLGNNNNPFIKMPLDTPNAPFFFCLDLYKASESNNRALTQQVHIVQNKLAEAEALNNKNTPSENNNHVNKEEKKQTEEKEVLLFSRAKQHKALTRSSSCPDLSHVARQDDKKSAFQ